MEFIPVLCDVLFTRMFDSGRFHIMYLWLDTKMKQTSIWGHADIETVIVRLKFIVEYSWLIVLLCAGVCLRSWNVVFYHECWEFCYCPKCQVSLRKLINHLLTPTPVISLCLCFSLFGTWNSCKTWQDDYKLCDSFYITEKFFFLIITSLQARN